jgi:hypothetical protein
MGKKIGYWQQPQNRLAPIISKNKHNNTSIVLFIEWNGMEWNEMESMELLFNYNK